MAPQCSNFIRITFSLCRVWRGFWRWCADIVPIFEWTFTAFFMHNAAAVPSSCSHLPPLILRGWGLRA